MSAGGENENGDGDRSMKLVHDGLPLVDGKYGGLPVPSVWDAAYNATTASNKVTGAAGRARTRYQVLGHPRPHAPKGTIGSSSIVTCGTGAAVVAPSSAPMLKARTIAATNNSAGTAM